MGQYIHYGSKHFDIYKFKEIENYFFTKPTGGLWAFPVDAQFGWKEWCEREDFRFYEKDDYFKFSLCKGARVLHIHSKDDLIDLPRNELCSMLSKSKIYLDFKKLSLEYDAIELHLSEDKAENFADRLYYQLYSWDCDSIIIMNPFIIIPE